METEEPLFAVVARFYRDGLCTEFTPTTAKQGPGPRSRRAVGLGDVAGERRRRCGRADRGVRTGGDIDAVLDELRSPTVVLVRAASGPPTGPARGREGIDDVRAFDRAARRSFDDFASELDELSRRRRRRRRVGHVRLARGAAAASRSSRTTLIVVHDSRTARSSGSKRLPGSQRRPSKPPGCRSRRCRRRTSRLWSS